MSIKNKNFFLGKLFFWVIVFLLVFLNPVFAQTITPTPSPQDNSQQVSDLQNKISELQDKVNSLQSTEKTLSSQISIMDSQVQLTTYRIAATKQQILFVEEDIDTTKKKISNLESAFSDLTTILMKRIVAGYQIGSENQFITLLSSSTISDFFKRSTYLSIVERHDKRLIYDTVQAKNDYANQKQLFEEKKQKILALKTQLENYTKDLNEQKSAKQALLSETQGDEATYQNLLAQAKAQLEGFSGFALSQGGADLLSNQTSCDDWGCYYNQRDTQWGGSSLNNTKYTLASDGCLITSMAMVYTHYGYKNVTPQSINGNPSNFAPYYPAFLKYDISANGVSSQRVGAYIDSVLATGNPVIVGIRYGNGNTHFVVLRGGTSGNYLMNDPFTPNGKNIAFSSKYSVSSIFEVDKVVF